MSNSVGLRCVRLSWIVGLSVELRSLCPTVLRCVVMCCVVAKRVLFNCDELCCVRYRSIVFCCVALYWCVELICAQLCWIARCLIFLW